MWAGLWARKGFEGVYLADSPLTGWAGLGERWRKRGIWMIGVKLKSYSQQQGPGLLLNSMHVSKYESANDLAKLIFCNAYLHPTQFGPLNF